MNTSRSSYKNRNISDFFEDFFYDSLIQSNTNRNRCIPRFFDKCICFFESIPKIWIIVHISQSIIIRKKRKSWRRDFLCWIEIPIIVIDIILTIIEDISFIECKRKDGSWKSTIRSYFITVLIEYNVSFRIVMSKQAKDVLLIREIEREDVCKRLESTTNILKKLYASILSLCILVSTRGLTEIIIRKLQ